MHWHCNTCKWQIKVLTEVTVTTWRRTYLCCKYKRKMPQKFTPLFLLKKKKNILDWMQHQCINLTCCHTEQLWIRKMFWIPGKAFIFETQPSSHVSFVNCLLFIISQLAIMHCLSSSDAQIRKTWNTPRNLRSQKPDVYYTMVPKLLNSPVVIYSVRIVQPWVVCYTFSAIFSETNQIRYRDGTVEPFFTVGNGSNPLHLNISRLND